MILRSPILALLLWSGAAHAGDFHLMLSEHVERSAAEVEAKAVEASGQAVKSGTWGARVSRRFVRGAGWRYQVRLGDFDSREAAESVARSLPVQGVIQVFEGQGYRRIVVAEVGGTGEAPPPVTVASEAPAAAVGGLPVAKTLLRSAAKAHGGRSGAVQRVQASDGIRFSFRSRSVVGGEELVADHVYYRSALGTRLEVEVVRGDGVSSVVVLTPSQESWVATDEAVTPRDGIQSGEMLARFAPDTGLLSIPLGLPTDVNEAAEWQDVATVARVDLDGSAHYRVAPESGDPDNALVAALFDVDTHLLSRVTWLTRGGSVTFDFRDYRSPAKGVVIPYRVRVERDGKLVEEVEVAELALNPELRKELFSEPGVLRRKRR